MTGVQAALAVVAAIAGFCLWAVAALGSQVRALRRDVDAVAAQVAVRAWRAAAPEEPAIRSGVGEEWRWP